MPDGSLKLETKGFKGIGCKDASKFLEKLGDIQSDDRTGEYYEDTSTKEKIKTLNGN
mgnify:FL=1